MMNKTKQERLEQAGWKVGSAEDFLELTPEEVQYIELKLILSNAVKERRQEMALTQAGFAEKVGSSQSRIAKMEKGDPSVSIDLLIKSLFALDATRQDLSEWLRL